MLTTAQKIVKLEDAIALLQDADALQQAALGDCDVAYETHNAIEGIIDDITEDIQNLRLREDANYAE